MKKRGRGRPKKVRKHNVPPIDRLWRKVWLSAIVKRKHGWDDLKPDFLSDEIFSITVEPDNMLTVEWERDRKKHSRTGEIKAFSLRETEELLDCINRIKEKENETKIQD